MFKDIQISKDLYADLINNPNNLVSGVDLQSVQVLTNGNWPIDESTPC